VKKIANKALLIYKSVIHYGGKAGESLWSHTMNLVMTAEKLHPLFNFTDEEMCCLLLALIIHDLNKLDKYGKGPDGKEKKYANAATRENVEAALNDLNGKSDIDSFFPAWRAYVEDIKYLADAHEVKSLQSSQYDQHQIDRCRLEGDRLEGPLKHLMRVADVSDNSHSSNYADQGEHNVRRKLQEHLNAALNSVSYPRRYRFIGYRLAELRGLLTNIIHNTIITFLREMYGKETCIDLLYHAEGTDFLLDRQVPFAWSPEMYQQLATKIGQKLAELQSEQLSQFIQAKPWGIAVDDAALQSGALPSAIFSTIIGIVTRKRYPADKREQYTALIRADLQDFLEQNQEQDQVALRQMVQTLLQEPELVPASEYHLKRGEFLMAYRNFLKDHRAEQLKKVKQDAWERASRVFQLPPEFDALYQVVNSYRRGYVMARVISDTSLEALLESVLEDLVHLEEEANEAASTKKKSQNGKEELAQIQKEQTLDVSSDHTALIDYLKRNLQFWDDEADIIVQPTSFQETLRRYIRDADPERQCCYCGSALAADEWMALQVPPSIAVQSFSNRLEGGSSREPKRNVCPICRNQFILEKLAWQSHRDKHGKDQTTFYLHLFPYSYFTQPLLQAWWQRSDRLSLDQTDRWYTPAPLYQCVARPYWLWVAPE
jgi:CRISPR-associated protein Csc3